MFTLRKIESSQELSSGFDSDEETIFCCCPRCVVRMMMNHLHKKHSQTDVDSLVLKSPGSRDNNTCHDNIYNI